MRSILLHIQDDRGLKARFEIAGDIARAFDSHVTCLNSIPYEETAPGEPYGFAFSAMVPIIREAAAELKQKITTDLENEDFAWDYHEVHGGAYHALIAHAALSDLVILGTADAQIGGARPAPALGAFLTHARSPALVVPEGSGRFDVSAPALVAWDGSAEASNALRAAMPLLARAKSVHIASVEEDEREGDERGVNLDAAQYLARHGIEAEISTFPVGAKHPADVLAEAALARDAGYIVMGAYGRSRLAEFVFGGVTRHMLKNASLPLLLAH